LPHSVVYNEYPNVKIQNVLRLKKLDT